MKRYFLGVVILMLVTSLNVLAQNIEINIEIKTSNINAANFDLEITVNNAKPEYNVYLYDFEKPSWKGGQPIQTLNVRTAEELQIKNIPAGKYYVVIVDADSNAAIKLVDIK